MGCVYYHHEVNKWYVCGALDGVMKERCQEKLKHGIYKQTDEWIDAKYFRIKDSNTGGWIGEQPIISSLGYPSLFFRTSEWQLPGQQSHCQE